MTFNALFIGYIFISQDFKEDKLVDLYEINQTKVLEYTKEGEVFYVGDIPLDEKWAERKEGTGGDKGKYIEEEYKLKEGYSEKIYEKEFERKIIYK